MGCIDKSRGFLGRLARDVRGNTIAIMAAAMMPLAGLVGGGVDMSRLYLTKTRLQQACDAGALAGRKAMGALAWSKRSDPVTSGGGANSDEAKAEAMFGANFSAGQYGTNTLAKHFDVQSDNSVKGTASVHVPMTIMKIFGMGERVMNVNCTAKMEIPQHGRDVRARRDLFDGVRARGNLGQLHAGKCRLQAHRRSEEGREMLL